MTHKRILCFCILALPCIVLTAASQPFTQSKFKQVVNKVSVVPKKDDGSLGAPADAEKGALFRAPDLIQTGRKSRAQLEADDGTITRVGSNTTFSFEPTSRTINLEKGNLLFNSPSGKGGGRIVTASASASVLGTTITVSANSSGGFKVMCLEGVARVRHTDGSVKSINRGQMTFVMPGRSPAGPVVNFDLKRAVDGSQLVSGFEDPLPSMDKISEAIEDQQQEIEEGGLQETDAQIIDAVNANDVALVVDPKDKSGEDNTLTDSSGNALGGVAGFDITLACTQDVTLTDVASVSAVHIAKGETSINLNSDWFGNTFVDENSTDSSDLIFNTSAKYVGIFAKNVTLNPTGGTLSLATVTATSGSSAIVLIAKETITIGRSFTVSGFGSAPALRVASKSFTGSSTGLTVTISGSGVELEVRTVNSITLADFSISNESGAIDIHSQGAIAWTLGTLTGTTVTIAGDTGTTLTGTSDNNLKVFATTQFELDPANAGATAKLSYVTVKKNSSGENVPTVSIFGDNITVEHSTIHANSLNVGTYTPINGSSTNSTLVTLHNLTVPSTTSATIKGKTVVFANLNLTSSNRFTVKTTNNSASNAQVMSSISSTPMTGYFNFVNGSITCNGMTPTNASQFASYCESTSIIVLTSL